MVECGVCPSKALNGARVIKEDGEWRITSDKNEMKVCRGCAKALVHDRDEDVRAMEKRCFPEAFD